MATRVERAPRPTETYTLYPGDLESILARLEDLSWDTQVLEHYTENDTRFDRVLKPKLTEMVKEAKQASDTMRSFVGELTDGFEVTVQPVALTGVGISSERLEEVGVSVEVFLELLLIDQTMISADEFREVLRGVFNSRRSVGFKVGR